MILPAALVMVLALPSAGGGGTDAGAVRKEVLAAVSQVAAAGMRRDADALEKLYAPDYFHTNPDGSVMSRSEVLASYRSGETPFTFDRSEASDERVVLRGRFAVVNERVALHGEKKGSGKFASRYRVTYLLERSGGGWRVVNSHSSLIGIEPEAPPK